MKPRIYRSSPGRWHVRVEWLPYDVGPFPSGMCAIRYTFATVARGQ
ncbi:hypothetical protein ABDK96_01940 [Citricoccus nitrophenolicus]|uniref:Uncharacterized protein n=1 Tax=Citricoccus nitrophenolicus TaxID=863575 RepID=A0ABV0IE44_9MICC